MALIDRFTLPDPTRFLRTSFWKPDGCVLWHVIAHPYPQFQAGGTFHQRRTLTVWSTEDGDDAHDTSVELQTWLIVTRKLMDLPT